MNNTYPNRLTTIDGETLMSKPLQPLNFVDEICLAYGLCILDECASRTKMKRMKPSEYPAGLRGNSWKLDLIQVINEALEYAISGRASSKTWRWRAAR